MFFLLFSQLILIGVVESANRCEKYPTANHMLSNAPKNSQTKEENNKRPQIVCVKPRCFRNIQSGSTFPAGEYLISASGKSEPTTTKSKVSIGVGNTNCIPHQQNAPIAICCLPLKAHHPAPYYKYV